MKNKSFVFLKTKLFKTMILLCLIALPAIVMSQGPPDPNGPAGGGFIEDPTNPQGVPIDNTLSLFVLAGGVLLAFVVNAKRLRKKQVE